MRKARAGLEMCESGTNSMKCKDCEFHIVGKTKSDEEMLKLGYKTCYKARNEIERATFVRGWVDRLNDHSKAAKA